jgi:hypothetical protein
MWHLCAHLVELIVVGLCMTVFFGVVYLPLFCFCLVLNCVGKVFGAVINAVGFQPGLGCSL